MPPLSPRWIERLSLACAPASTASTPNLVPAQGRTPLQPWTSTRTPPPSLLLLLRLSHRLSRSLHPPLRCRLLRRLRQRHQRPRSASLRRRLQRRRLPRLSRAARTRRCGLLDPTLPARLWVGQWCGCREPPRCGTDRWDLDPATVSDRSSGESAPPPAPSPTPVTGWHRPPPPLSSSATPFSAAHPNSRPQVGRRPGRRPLGPRTGCRQLPHPPTPIATARPQTGPRVARDCRCGSRRSCRR